MNGSTAAPLAGVRVLALEQYGAGPWATLLLADLGAEVIKVEPPGAGDVGRTIPPWAEAGDSLFFQAFNRNKRSIALDVADPRGYAVLCRLVQHVDAVFANPRGDLPEKLRLSYRHLSAHNPRLVCCFLTAFGTDGPRAKDPGYDYIIQALTGLMAVTGEPDGPPVRAGLSLMDFSAGFAAALALLAGVMRARDTGRGGDLETSLFDTGMSLLNYVACWHLTRGYQPERLSGGAHPSVVPSQLFPTRDGWLMVMCQKDKFYQALVAALGQPGLVADQRFHTMAGRLAHREELVATLTEIFRQETTAHWVQLLQGRVPTAPVNTVAAAFQDPQAAARGTVIAMEHPRFGKVRMVRGPIQVPGWETQHRACPPRGADTAAVLREWASLGAPELAALQAAGVIEVAPPEA